MLKHATLVGGLLSLTVLPVHEPSPCGDFEFVGVPYRAGLSMELRFRFDPRLCEGPPCACGEIAWIQMVRIIDSETGRFLAPNGEQHDRMVRGTGDPHLDGWAVDRMAGRIWGHFGRNDDGSYAWSVRPGGNGSAALLIDEPQGWEPKTHFEAVSVPVCLDSNSPCLSQLPGCYRWFFATRGNRTATRPSHGAGVESHHRAFEAATDQWNADASRLQKRSFPSLTWSE